MVLPIVARSLAPVRARQAIPSALRDEAARVVEEELARLRAQDHATLLREEGRTEHRDVTTAGGVTLVLETHVLFDGRSGPDLRVMVDVWDFRRRRFQLRIPCLAKGDFILAPDGSLVGE